MLRQKTEENETPVLYPTLILLDVKENGSYDQSEERSYCYLNRIKTQYTVVSEAAVPLMATRCCSSYIKIVQKWFLKIQRFDFFQLFESEHIFRPMFWPERWRSEGWAWGCGTSSWEPIWTGSGSWCCRWWFWREQWWSSAYPELYFLRETKIQTPMTKDDQHLFIYSFNYAFL